MILGDLSDTKRVEALHPLLGKLFSYIKEHDFLSDPIGRIELPCFFSIIRGTGPAGHPPFCSAWGSAF